MNMPHIESVFDVFDNTELMINLINFRHGIEHANAGIFDPLNVTRACDLETQNARTMVGAHLLMLRDIFGSERLCDWNVINSTYTARVRIVENLRNDARQQTPGTSSEFVLPLLECLTDLFEKSDDYLGVAVDDVVHAYFHKTNDDRMLKSACMIWIDNLLRHDMTRDFLTEGIECIVIDMLIASKSHGHALTPFELQAIHRLGSIVKSRTDVSAYQRHRDTTGLWPALCLDNAVRVEDVATCHRLCFRMQRLSYVAYVSMDLCLSMRAFLQIMNVSTMVYNYLSSGAVQFRDRDGIHGVVWSHCAIVIDMCKLTMVNWGGSIDLPMESKCLKSIDEFAHALGLLMTHCRPVIASRSPTTNKRQMKIGIGASDLRESGAIIEDIRSALSLSLSSLRGQCVPNNTMSSSSQMPKHMNPKMPSDYDDDVESCHSSVHESQTSFITKCFPSVRDDIIDD